MCGPCRISSCVKAARVVTHARTRLMKVSGLVKNLGDNFSYGWLKQAPPCFDHLTVDALGSSRSSFIDMEDPAELFSMRWTTTTTSDFDFGVLVLGGSAASLGQLVSAS
ncbi:uncharacterized protein LOC125531978 [Triticum urartu]|uniref:uncharacterized protein LOC125531978 n=1 Tax=Triticum urartu TaxID=4572 RepID=UPI00204448C5|nr:uncharacterized protein LOC125531978 [Triticum urartu]